MKILFFPAEVMPHIHESDVVKGQKWAVISISGSDGWPEITPNEDCLGVLRLQFHDVDRPVSWLPEAVLFNEDHAGKVLDFVQKVIADKLDVLLVHCYAGLSRSPAVAAALHEIYGQKNESDRIFRHTVPNRLVYRKLLEANARRRTYGSG